MSDQECAFDNWEDAAQQLQKQEQIQKQEEPKNIEQQQTAQQINDALNQQQKAVKAPIDPKEAMKQKIGQYQKISFEQFQANEQQLSENNKIALKKIGNPVLKSDKDFNNYARILAKRFDNMVQNQQATIDDEKLSLFVEELTLYMYKNFEWKNLHDVQAKLKVIKKQRKTEQDKRRKLKQKQERLKKVQGQGSESKSQSQPVSKQQKKEDDLFGGVSTINSKQQQDERKNMIITQEPKKQDKKEESEDDDDFM